MSDPVVVIVGADKGGVGKTTVCRALLDYLKAQGVSFRAFDTETPEGVLKRYYPEKAELVDLSKSDGQMRVFDTLKNTEVTVIDVRAGLLTPTLKTLGDIGFLEMAAEGKLKIIVLHVLGSSIASLNEIKATANAIPGCKHFLITNHMNEGTFFEWDGDLKASLLSLGSAVVDVPKLNELAVEHVESAGVPFSGYVSNPENSMVMRGYVRNWMTKVFAEFGKAKFLGE